MSDKFAKPFQIGDIALQIFDALPDSYSVIDLTFRYLYVNRAFAARYDQVPGDIIGKTPEQMVGRAVFDETINPHLTACMRGESVEYEEVFNIPTRGSRWMSVRYTPLHDEAGKVYAVFSTIRDITRGKEDEQERRRAIELSRQAANIAGVGHLLWDEVNDRQLYFSKIIPEIYGMTPDEFVRRAQSKSGLMNVIEDDRERISSEYDKCVLHGQSYDLKYRIHRDDGETRWVHEIGEPYEVKEGRAISTLITMRDITEEVTKRETLERERFFIRQVEEVIGAGMFIWDVETQRNIYCSDSLAHMHGMTPEEMEATVVGEDADVDLAHPDDRERVAEAYRQSRLHGTPLDVEYRITHPEKGLRWVNEVAVRRTLGDGERDVTMGLLHDVTEHKGNQEELETQRLLAAQAEKIGKLGYWMWDMVEDRALYFSDQVAAMHGVSREEFAEMQASPEADLARVHPDDRGRVSAATRRSRENSEPFDEEYRIIHPDGETHWVHEIGVPHKVVNGKMTLALGTLQDITERKKGEEELRQRDIIYRQIEESIQIGYWTWDEENYGVTYCSEGVPKIYGLSPEEYREKTVSIEGEVSLVHQEDQGRVRDALVNFQETAEPYDIEYRIAHTDGSVRWVHEVSAALRVSDTGKLTASIGTLRDITARKLEEEDLYRRNVLFSQVEDNFDIGFWIWDEEPYGMSYVSDAYCRIHGKSKGEMHEQSSSVENELAAIHPDDRAHMKEVFARLTQKGIPYDEEFRIIRKDGAVRWVHEVTAPLRVRDDGSAASNVGSMRDVTERREREEELRREKLRAEQASRAKSDFLAHMSHELRTPLNAVIGFSDAIRTEVFGPLGDERYREYMDNIQNSGRLLLALINDLLDMSAIEAGEMPIDLEPQNIASLVREMLELAGPSARAKNISLTGDVGFEDLTLIVDPRRFRQIVLNLLINAVKYTRNGGDVTIAGGINDQGCPTIAIRDNGVGMTEDEQEAALIPFKQIRDARVRQVEGTGIGLPLTNQLVELHRGTLTIESEKGKGTTVTVTLPVERLVH